MRVKVLLVDDQPELRRLVRRWFSMQDPELEIVAEAGSGAEALEHVDAGADVAVVDAMLPDRDGIELAAELRAASPRLRIVLFTGHVDPRVRTDAAACGIDAVVLKDAVAELAETVAAVAAR